MFKTLIEQCTNNNYGLNSEVMTNEYKLEIKYIYENLSIKFVSSYESTKKSDLLNAQYIII